MGALCQENRLSHLANPSTDPLIALASPHRQFWTLLHRFGNDPTSMALYSGRTLADDG